MPDPDRWQLMSAGHVVIEKCRGERLALIVIRDLLVQRGADPLHHAAADLTLDKHRIDHRAAILRDREIEQFDRAGLRVDRYDRAMSRVRVNARTYARLARG